MTENVMPFPGSREAQAAAHKADVLARLRAAGVRSVCAAMDELPEADWPIARALVVEGLISDPRPPRRSGRAEAAYRLGTLARGLTPDLDGVRRLRERIVADEEHEALQDVLLDLGAQALLDQSRVRP
jgi:hypothetical protein